MEEYIPHISLSQVVKEYNLATYNDKQKYYLNTLVHAKWIWKELFIKSLFISISQYVKVDKTTNPYSIVIPKGMYRFLNLSTENSDGTLRSYVFDNSMNTVPVQTGTICNTCNESDDLGQCITNITPTIKTVTIRDNPYTEKIWKQLCKNGDVLEIREIPTLDIDENGDETVVTITKERLIANLELKKCGCVKKTDQNKQYVVSCCGIMAVTNKSIFCKPTINQVGTRKGYIKIAQGRIWVKGNVPDYMILDWQANGECSENVIMVPEYAVSALIFGIKWRSMALAANKGPGEIRAAKIAYDSQVEELDMFLNPIRKEEFMNVQMVLPKWGSEVDQSDMRGNSWYDCDDIPCITGSSGLTATDIQNLINNCQNNIVLLDRYSITESGNRVYTQIDPVMQAVIVHGLGRNPVVVITDLENYVIDADVSYPSDNISVLVKFNTPRTFKVILS